MSKIIVVNMDNVPGYDVEAILGNGPIVASCHAENQAAYQSALASLREAAADLGADAVAAMGLSCRPSSGGFTLYGTAVRLVPAGGPRDVSLGSPRDV
ncbi:MAG TPA: hypothetical protein VMS08_04075 [Candidatus Saccharimonadia bacterium]|nr:hypothetical protein [Candidatus Saccharimonadia bacterium]